MTYTINIVNLFYGEEGLIIKQEWLKMLSYRHQLQHFVRMFMPQGQNNSLTSGELEILTMIFICPESTLNDLSRQSGMKKEAVSRLLKQLYFKKCIKKEKHPTDERSYILSLTDEGIKMLKENQSRILKPFYELKRNMGDDFDRLFELISQVVDSENKND